MSQHTKRSPRTQRGIRRRRLTSSSHRHVSQTSSLPVSCHSVGLHRRGDYCHCFAVRSNERIPSSPCLIFNVISGPCADAVRSASTNYLSAGTIEPLPRVPHLLTCVY